MCSGEMRAGFPKQVAGLVFCLSSKDSVSATAGTRERKGARGWEGGQSCSFSSRKDCGAAGIANRLVAITGREAGFGLSRC